MSTSENTLRPDDSALPAAIARKGYKGNAVGRAPSELYYKYQRRKAREKWLVRFTQLALLVAFLGAWEVAARTHLVNPMLTSYPSALWPTFVDLLNTSSVNQQGNLIHHTLVTLAEVAGSFSVSMVLGVLVAGVLWWSPFVYRVLDPYLVVANAMPKVALVPIFYIWLGDTLSIYGIAIAIAGFITTLMIYSGFRETDPGKIKLMRALGASKRQVFTKLVLPANVPILTAALKANIGLVLVGVIVGEFQSSRAGLGYLIVYGSQIFQMNLVMTAIMMLAIISTVMYALVFWLEAYILKGRYVSTHH